jgi:hypothetical protein
MTKKKRWKTGIGENTSREKQNLGRQNEEVKDIRRTKQR